MHKKGSPQVHVSSDMYPGQAFASHIGAGMGKEAAFRTHIDEFMGKVFWLFAGIAFGAHIQE